MGEFTIDAEDKKELAEKIKNRLENYKEWLADFRDVFAEYKASNTNLLAKIHKNLPNVKKLEYTKHAAEILNHKYWDIVSNYLRLSLISSGKVDESKVINRYKVISATELTIMTIRPIVFSGGDDGEETEKFLNALFAWYIAIVLIHSWEAEDRKKGGGKGWSVAQSTNNILKISSLFEPALKDEKVTINFRDEHLRWLAFVETDSYIPVLSNAQTWRMFYFCLQAMNNGLKDFTKTTGINSKQKQNENRGNTATSPIRNTSRKVSRK